MCFLLWKFYLKKIFLWNFICKKKEKKNLIFVLKQNLLRFCFCFHPQSIEKLFAHFIRPYFKFAKATASSNINALNIFFQGIVDYLKHHFFVLLYDCFQNKNIVTKHNIWLFFFSIIFKFLFKQKHKNCFIILFFSTLTKHMDVLRVNDFLVLKWYEI